MKLADRIRIAFYAFALDKRLHFAAGAAVSSVAALLWEMSPLPPHHGAVAGLAAGLAAGVAKELYDRDRQEAHDVEVADVVATFLGAAAVAIVLRVLGLA